jgi:hypothetical protein
MDRIRALMKSDHAWWQGGVFIVLVGGLLVVVYLLRNRQMDFIYSLF